MTARADAGVVGMWIFLGSTSVLFAALVFSYALLRAQSPGWVAAAAGLPARYAVASTAALVLSSVALSTGQRRLGAGRPGVGRCILGALALGGLFLALQGALVCALFGAGLPVLGLVRSLVLLLAGVHAAHVLAALLALALTAPALCSPAPAPRAVHRLRLAAMFWHFVDVTWLALFLVLFVA